MFGEVEWSKDRCTPLENANAFWIETRYQLQPVPEILTTVDPLLYHGFEDIIALNHALLGVQELL